MRLDTLLFTKNLASSRNIASTLIKQNLVTVNGHIVNKSSYFIKPNDIVNISEQKVYVSRAANKLLGFLDGEISSKIDSCTVLDIGSSTGGFCEVLLEKNAKKVVCVDVGTNQLSPKLRDNAKVELHEQTDIREFDSSEKFKMITVDVSFISLNNIIAHIDRLSIGEIIVLFKPQFEVGTNVKRDKRGKVLDKDAIDNTLKSFIENTKALQWKHINTQKSTLDGKNGNTEYFIRFTK